MAAEPLNVRPHYHLVVLDGVFGKDGGGRIEFHEAHELTPDHIPRVESLVQQRILRYFRRHGFLDELDAAGMLTWRGSGGFSVDASVRIEAADRAGLERLVRYCARPPFALERLHALGSTPALASPESRLLYRFPKPDIHGRTELLLTRLDALSKFVPPPRVHRHRYHGVLAPNARLRPHVVALGRPEAPTAEGDFTAAAPAPATAAEPAPERASPARAERPQGTSREADPEVDPRDDRGSPRRGDRRSIRWAVLLARTYDVLPLLCPACGAEMRVLAFAFGELASLGSDRSARRRRHPPPPRAPPQTPTPLARRGPPQSDLLTGLLNQTPTFDPAGPEPVPDFDFDQSLPDDFDP